MAAEVPRLLAAGYKIDASSLLKFWSFRSNLQLRATDERMDATDVGLRGAPKSAGSPLRVIRVLVVAEATAFAGLRRVLRAGRVDVVATASTTTGALTLLRQARPDVVVLDLELPQLDATALVAQLIEQRIAPVLGLVARDDGAGRGGQALRAGVSDVVERPALRLSEPNDAGALALTQRVEALASVRPGERAVHPSMSSSALAASIEPLTFQSAAPGRCRVVVIGASTGGTQALTDLLRELPANAAPVLVVQHMLPEFTRDFAERLNAVCHMRVREADHGDRVERGRVLIAPGGRHLRLGRDLDGGLCAFLSQEAPVGKHRPSVDVLFHSAAEVAGACALGVLLTGMGDDGARGLLAMRRAGCLTVAQDRASSVCFGMPSAAIECGAAQEVMSLPEITRTLVELVRSPVSSPARR